MNKEYQRIAVQAMLKRLYGDLPVRVVGVIDDSAAEVVVSLDELIAQYQAFMASGVTLIAARPALNFSYAESLIQQLRNLYAQSTRTTSETAVFEYTLSEIIRLLGDAQQNQYFTDYWRERLNNLAILTLIELHNNPLHEA